MESDKYICVRETGAVNNVVIVDMQSPLTPMKKPITADSALMNPVTKVIALKARVESPDGEVMDSLQIFNIDQKAKIKGHDMEAVVYWKWITPKMLGIVTNGAVYHWSIDDSNAPTKIFDRTANLNGNQIISYKASADMQWFTLIGIAQGDASRPALVKGNMQLFSVAQQRSQALEAHMASFATHQVPGNAQKSQLVVFAQKMVQADGQIASKLHVIELGAPAGQTPFTKRTSELFFPPEFADDFPVVMHVSDKYGVIYIATKNGLLFVYDLETATPVYRSRISQEPVFVGAEAPNTGGFYVVNRGGQVLSVTLNEAAVVPFISTQLNNLELALSLASRGNLPGADVLVMPKFDMLFNSGDYKAAAELAASMNTLRNDQTIARFRSVPTQPGQSSPLLQYFGACLQRGKLNKLESVELAKLVLAQNKQQLLDTWLAEDKLEASEELGDLVAPTDADTALKLYIKARASPKVVTAFAQRGEFDKLAQYCGAVDYKPDYMYILQSLMMQNPASAVSLAQQLSQMTPSPVDMGKIADLFLQRNMIREATSILLDLLKEDDESQAALQTKVLEINLVTYPNVADAIMAQGKLTHYDRPRIAQLCEKAGLYVRAMEHYTELSDLKRCVVNTHSMDPAALTEFFGTLSREWALDCLKELLKINMRQNLQIAVNIAKEYTEQLTIQDIMKMFTKFDSHEGLFYYLGHFVNTCEDKEVVFKFIEAAAKTNQIKEVERVTRENEHYDPERVKVFLMEAKLADARPLINVCDRFDFVPDLTTYLYNNNMLRYIEGYVQKVNPKQAPKVVGTLLDLECPDDFIKTLILSVRSLLPVAPLVEEVEKRNRLKILTQFLEHLVNEGSVDPQVHNAMGKMLIDSNQNPEHFLLTNEYYESAVVGRYCEKRDPYLACVAYKRGKCDAELVDCTNRNSMFKVQARYVVERMDAELWASVLTEDNKYCRQLIDQVVSTALPESKNPEQVSVTVKAFMTAEMPHELIELLEKIVLQNSAFSNNPNLQNLLILTAIKADPSRVMDYVNRLDAFNGPEVGEIAAGNELYEEAFAIFKKFDLHVDAMKIILESLEDLDRGIEYARKVDLPEVWVQLGKAQLRIGTPEAVKSAIKSYIKAQDGSDFVDVIHAAQQADMYEDMVPYLLMVRKAKKEARVDTELVYAYAKINDLAKLEDFLATPNSANQQTVADRCFNEGLYEAARLLYTALSNWSCLASTLLKLRLFQAAVDAAKKANSPRTWKEVCFCCIEENEYKLAQLAGLNIIIQADELDAVSEYYQVRGKFTELIALMEAGVGVDRAHMGIFTELGMLYASHKPEKLMEHIRLFSARINIPRLISQCINVAMWSELAYLYRCYDEFDNACEVMMNHPDAWEHVAFKDVCAKLANADLYYKAIKFYLRQHPTEMNNLLGVLQPRLDHSRVVALMRKENKLPMVKEYLLAVQGANLTAVNDAVNELAIEEEDHAALKTSLDMYDNCDQISLAIQCESHELIEFRRISSYIYQRNARWKQAIELSKRDGLMKDAMEVAAKSGDAALVDELLDFFIDQGNKECFASCLCTCYDLLTPDVIMQKAWLKGLTDWVMPYMIQVLRDMNGKIDTLMKEKAERNEEKVNEEKERIAAEMNSNLYAQLMPAALPAPPVHGFDQGQGAYGGAQQYGGAQYGGY